MFSSWDRQNDNSVITLMIKNFNRGLLYNQPYDIITGNLWVFLVLLKLTTLLKCSAVLNITAENSVKKKKILIIIF